MEDYLNENESRLFDLIETKNWEELSSEEQLFVAQHISMEEYRLQRNVVLGAEDLYQDEILPLPLALPGTEKRTVTQRTIPMYQALIAIAATILIFLWIWPRDNQTEIAQAKTPANQTNAEQAVAQTKTEYVYDTIVRYVTLVKNAEKAVKDTVYKMVSLTQIVPEPILLQASAPPLPDLKKENLSTTGTSLKEDNTSQLLPRIVNTIY